MKIVVIDGNYPSYRHETEILRRAGYSVEVFRGARHDRDAKIAFAKGALGILVRWTKLDEYFFSEVPTVRAVVRYGVGYDNIDLKAATRRGVRVSNVQGYANHSVSEHALALMFACLRDLPHAAQAFKSRFTNPPRAQIFEFHGKNLGIIGLGRIGGTLCQKAKGIFGRVLAVDPYIPDERFRQLGAEKVDFQVLLAESQVISLHCNLTGETTRLIDESAFAMMKQRPILINTARGPVVDADALLKALKTNRIHCAGLDVFWEEPPGENRAELLAHPHVLATGHYAWYSDAAFAELKKRAAQNMVALLQGKIPEDCLNP